MFHLNLLYLKNNNFYLKTNNFALTEKTSDTSKEKLYQELGIESLQLRCCYGKLCLFYKMFKNKSPAYLFNLIPARNRHDSLRSSDNICCYNTKHNSFFFFFLHTEYNRIEQIKS